jgi:hypothetical protein
MITFRSLELPPDFRVSKTEIQFLSPETIPVLMLMKSPPPHFIYPQVAYSIRQRLPNKLEALHNGASSLSLLLVPQSADNIVGSEQTSGKTDRLCRKCKERQRIRNNNMFY